jgi:hypothetical protein
MFPISLLSMYRCIYHLCMCVSIYLSAYLLLYLHMYFTCRSPACLHCVHLGYNHHYGYQVTPVRIPDLIG